MARAFAAGHTQGGNHEMEVVCFSHLRWDFVYQRPQHLLSRAARDGRVLFIEEEVRSESALAPHAALTDARPGVTICRPTLPIDHPAGGDGERTVAGLVASTVDAWRCGDIVAWHYAVMAEPLSRRIGAALTVYDCMDELSAFRFAPPELLDREERLLRRADIVFTGGWSLHEAKRDRHRSVHAFPSSVDVAHFAQARHEIAEPPALAPVGRPRLVYAGVIDERLDLGLLRDLAAARVGEVVLIGPVVKLSSEELPQAPNLHYLGMQPYDALPAFFGNADVGLMPFALNEATRFISPTKTPEYLAAGLPVVTTPVADVVRGYGDLPTVHVAAGSAAFVDRVLAALGGPRTSPEADARLAATSWDTTWERMATLIREQMARRGGAA